jgi:hypothetical protein
MSVKRINRRWPIEYGLAHSEDANSVMNANYNQSQVLTEQDLANIKNIPCGSKKKKKK